MTREGELDETVPSDSLSHGPPGGLRGMPKEISRFLVDAPLGAGGHGIVLLATDPVLGRPVALKLLREATQADAERRRRFLREAQTMAKLVHENIIVVHEVGTHEGQDYVAMEYVAGSTLARWQVGRSWRDIVGLYVRVGRGLAFAHDAGFVHRDFKPENVLVGDDGRVRVTDFGLAAMIDGNAAIAQTARGEHPSELASSLTHTGAVMGTPKYMAPEQHLSESVDARADQFAFCAALYEALYRQAAFAGDTYAELADNVIHRSPAKPPRSDVPPAIERAILRGLSRTPADRFPSLHELLAILSGAIAPPRYSTAAIISVAMACLAIAITIVAMVVRPYFRSRSASPAVAAEPAPSKPRSKMMGHALLEYEDAEAHYKNGRYVQAATAFLAAYEYQKLPSFIYNAAAAHDMRFRRASDATAVPEAIRLYRRYLEEEPAAEDRDVVIARIAALERELAPAD